MHFAAYADPDGDLGEDHNPETHLIPLVLDVMAGRSPYLQIFGYSVQQVIEAAKAGAEKARREVGWLPRYPQLEVILQHALPSPTVGSIHRPAGAQQSAAP